MSKAAYYGKLFIGGEWQEATGGKRRDVINPANGQVIGTIAAGTTADVDRAAQAARTAFDSGVWSGLPGRERSRILLKVSKLIRERADELAAAESADVGKPIMFAKNIDVTTAADQYEYFAAQAQVLDGSVRNAPLPVHAYTRREPVGVVAAITPFNFPLILSSSKFAPGLAAGNTFVHKPASETSLSALIMADILTDAGVPSGVFNVVTGSGSELGDHLVTHALIDKIAFTGSVEVGSHVAEIAGKALKPVTAELGGNGPNIVFADADVEKAVGTVINSFVFNTGQFCMAGPRLLVERPLYETVLGILGHAVGGVPLGDPSEPGTVIGPLVSQDQLDKVSGMVDAAKAAGARIVAGGEKLDINGGYFYPPTVIADVDDEAQCVKEEVFGPVLTVQAFDTEEEAIARANGTRYGLAAGVQTTNIARAHRVAAQLEAGIVWVNGWALLDPSIPFGGVRNSGWGRESGEEALLSYTRSKSVVIALD
jgi:acyl-CoA reductase-like NAD-dependent aldehyde dehydrogenase